MSLSPMPSACIDLPEMEAEKNNALQMFHQEEQKLAQSVGQLHQLCAIIEENENGKFDTRLLPQVEAALISYGISAEEALLDNELLRSVKTHLDSNKETTDDLAEKVLAESIASRMLELKDHTKLNILLATIRKEFAGKIDQETDGVLSKYEALFHPTFITDEKEREAVESLFWNQGSTDFSEDGFQGFIETIQAQPESVISEETKQKIKEKFIRRDHSLKDGTALLKAIHEKDGNGSLVHHSPDTAIILDSGVSTYTDEAGRTVMSYPSFGDTPAHAEFVSADKASSGEHLTQKINTSIVRRLVYNQFHGMIGLFGGAVSDGVTQGHYEEGTTRNVDRFVSCLLGKRNKSHMITTSEIHTLVDSLKAFTHPLNGNEAEDLRDMEALGIINKGGIHWSQMEKAGTILRANNGFKLHAMQDESAPYRLLKDALTQPET